MLLIRPMPAQPALAINVNVLPYTGNKHYTLTQKEVWDHRAVGKEDKGYREQYPTSQTSPYPYETIIYGNVLENIVQYIK